MKPPPLRPSLQAISLSVRQGEWRFGIQICLLLTIPLLANGNVNLLKKHENGRSWLDNDHAYQVFSLRKSTEIAPIVNLNTHRHLTSFDYDESESGANNEVIKAEGNSLENDSLSLKELLEQVERLQEETYRSERIFYAFAYGLIVVLSFLGNLLVCRVCLRNMTKTNALILSLAGSDLIMSCLNIPFTYFRIFSVNYSWPFGSAMCFIVNFVQHMVVYVSSYTMAIIAIQRYRSICGLQFETSNTGTSRSSINGCNCQLSASKVASRVGRWFSAMCHFCTPFPLCRQRLSRRQQIYSLRPIITSILVTWLLSAVISTLFTYSAAVVESPNISAEICSHYSRLAKVRTSQAKFPILVEPEMDPSCSLVMLRCQNPVPARVEKFLAGYSIKADLAKTIVVFVTQYFIPLTISCVLYIRIGKIISKQGKLATVQNNPKARIRQKKKRRRIIMLCLVVFGFGFFWFPLHSFHIFVDLHIINFNYKIFMLAHLFAMSSVCANPFIYSYLQPSFRKAAFRVFCFCCVKETVTNIEDGTNGNLPHSEKKSRVLLSKVPCCRHGSAAKKAHTSHRHTLNTTSNRLTAGNFLDTNTNLTSLSAQSSVSMVTEVSVVGFTSPGSVERLTETHVPRRHTGHSVSKTGRFAIFRRNREKLTNSCIHQVEVCQINIEECSDKCDVGRENVTCEYTSPESAAQLARPAEIRPRISSQTFNHCYNQRDSSDDDSDDCLLNERQADKASFELKPMVPRKIDINQNDSFSREHNQCISLVRKPTEQRHLDREKDKTDDILDKGNYPQEQFVLTTDL